MSLLVISDLGGLLGLFLGCSLISIVEMFYYIASGLIIRLFGLRSPKKRDIAIITVASARRGELQVSNNEILQALNALTSTVYNVNMKVDGIKQEMKQNNDILDGRLKVLDRKEAPLRVIDLN